MSASFFKKKWFILLGGFTAVATVFGVYTYTRYLHRATVEAVSQNYYFLVSESTHVEASAQEIQLNGGAGYLLEGNERDYVSICAYLSEEEAKTVQEGLEEDTRVVVVGVDKLYFRSRKDKQNAKKIVGAFQTMLGIIEVLAQETKRLDEGATQESSKRILETLKGQLLYLSKEYEKIFPSYANVCKRAAERLHELISGTVFVKDLRHLQCELCDSYVGLAEEFSI